MWVGNVTPNSFCAKSYDHLKLTQLHFPLKCLLIPTYDQTYKPRVHLRTVLVTRGSCQRVDEGGLDRRSRTMDRHLTYGLLVRPSIKTLANFSRLNFWEFLIPSTVVQDELWFRLWSVDATFGSTCRFF